MEYYKLLKLDREPFSNSPDPDYFFSSQQHLGCLQKLELALRLKRGLNIVIGDVGTGKTTLCRQLIRKFSDDPVFESHLILDPSFGTPDEFLSAIFQMFYGHAPDDYHSANELKEPIKQYLFTKGVDEKKTIVLIIDEGQKVSAACVEILRELLNYETNTFKLLQIVLFAQLEFKQILQQHANFTDRINLLHFLDPMSFKDTCCMVRHRLKLSSTVSKPQKLFTLPAMWAIYRASRGYPRKIIHLCHQSLLAMIIQNRTQAGWAIVRSCKNRWTAPRITGARIAVTIGMGLVLLLVSIGLLPRLLMNKSKLPLNQSFKVQTPMAIEAAASSGPQAGTNHPNDIKTIDAVSRAGESFPDKQLPVPAPEATKANLEKTGMGAQASGRPTASTGPIPSVMPSSPTPPDLLGQIVVKSGDTLDDLVHTVYGGHGHRPLKAVIDTNPHIQNPDKIDIGNVILFPAMIRDLRTGELPCHWIVLAEYGSLASAMRDYNNLADMVPVPLQMIPHWQSASGLRFFLSLKGYFLDEQQALSYLKAFPEEVKGKSKVFSHWAKGTLFYADPYAGGVLKSPIIP